MDDDDDAGVRPTSRLGDEEASSSTLPVESKRATSQPKRAACLLTAGFILSPIGFFLLGCAIETPDNAVKAATPDLHKTAAVRLPDPPSRADYR